MFAGHTVILLVLSCSGSNGFAEKAVAPAKAKVNIPPLYEPRHEKTCLRGFRPG